MNKNLKNLLIVMLLYCVNCGYAYGQQVSQDRLEALFTINNIAVDETAANASIARSQAISKAESIAFDKLKSKLVAINDLHLLSNTDFINIINLVRGIEVSEERAFSNRYIAKINVTFSPEEVMKIFTQAGASFILNAGSTLCVAHGHKQGLVTRLWEVDNRAKEIWQSTDLINKLRTYKIAQGTLKQRMALDAKAVEVGGFEAAETFANGCGTRAGLIIFSHAMPDLTNGGTIINYKYWISDMLIENEGTLYAPKDEGSSDVDAKLTQLIDDIIEISDESWRQKSMVRGDEKSEINLLIHTDQIKALVAAEQKLAGLSLVSNVSVKRIAIPFSQIRVSFTGSHDQFVQAISQVGYSLEAWGQESLLVSSK